MVITEERARLVGRAALAAAVVGTVVAPMHALARYATVEGKADLDLPGVRAWAEPARAALLPLLDWSDADTVYLTYGKVFVFIFAAATLCAFTVRSRRQPFGAEKWGWRIALTGYVLMTLGALGSYWTPYLDQFFAVVIPGLLLSLIGSTTLGIALLRRGFRPRATSWLLVTCIPALLVISNFVALGAATMPMVWAWALAGRRLAQVPELDAVPAAAAGVSPRA